MTSKELKNFKEDIKLELIYLVQGYEMMGLFAIQKFKKAMLEVSIQFEKIEIYNVNGKNGSSYANRIFLFHLENGISIMIWSAGEVDDIIEHIDWELVFDLEDKTFSKTIISDMNGHNLEYVKDIFFIEFITDSDWM